MELYPYGYWNKGCGSCGGSCGDCKPGCYDQQFSLLVDPFDSSYWNVTIGGRLFHIKAPTAKETDTSLSTNYTNSTLIYTSEYHTDTITGEQLGSLIRVGDLRDTKVDYNTPSMCYELIYHKYGTCGEGCQSVDNSWSTFSIDNKNALQDSLRYVRGVNKYGCPIYLDVPSNVDEYWYAGWRTDGEHKEFGYYQALPVDELPKNENGDTIVISQNPNGQPVVGTLPLECILNNIMGNLGVEVASQWSVIQQTPQFGATFNNITGEFKIKWTDWNDAGTLRAGYGEIDGQLVWTNHFDSKTGAQIFDITQLNFYKAKWTKDLGTSGSLKPKLTLRGVAIPSSAETDVIVAKEYGDSSWEQILNVSIPCAQTVTLNPGQSLGPFNFAYIFVDWIGDDEGYLGVVFKNKVTGWNNC